MKFDIRFVPNAQADLDYYQAREQRIILDALEKFLRFDADVESKRRKRLRPNALSPWELRIGDYRAFYEIANESIVRVLAIGHKLHNDLYIRGRRTVL
jgi:mRNA-degrading endonuclease RelE of RelBE toxin-antitoxin system